MKRFCLTFLVVFVFTLQIYPQEKNTVYVYDTVYVCIHDTLSSRWVKFDSFFDDGMTYVNGVFSILPPYRLHFYKLWTTIYPTVVIRKQRNRWSGYIQYRNNRVRIESPVIKVFSKQRWERPSINAGFFYSLRNRQEFFLLAYVPVSVFMPFSYLATRDFGFGINVNINRLIVRH